FCYNGSDVLLTAPDSEPTDDRIDIVVAQITDTVYGGGSDEWTLEYIQGTADVSPVAPDVPDDALLLAEVAVGNGVTAIPDSDITDMRDFSRSVNVLPYVK